MPALDRNLWNIFFAEVFILIFQGFCQLLCKELRCPSLRCIENTNVLMTIREWKDNFFFLLWECGSCC